MSILIKGTKMPKTCEECQSTLGLFADECPQLVYIVRCVPCER